MIRMPGRALLFLAALALGACQSPTDPDEVPDIIEVTVSPDPASAAGPTGKTYKIEGDEADEIREYPWKTSFTVSVRLTDAANDSSVGLELPLDITAATVRVQQASGGIVTPPTGSDVEKYEFVLAQASSNRFTAANSTIDMTFDVWYALPNTRREALVTVSLGFSDSGRYQFTELVSVKIAP